MKWRLEDKLDVRWKGDGSYCVNAIAQMSCLLAWKCPAACKAMNEGSTMTFVGKKEGSPSPLHRSRPFSFQLLQRFIVYLEILFSILNWQAHQFHTFQILETATMNLLVTRWGFVCHQIHECPQYAIRGLLKEAYRLLRPGGTVALTDNSVRLLNQLSSSYFANFSTSDVFMTCDLVSSVHFLNLNANCFQLWVGCGWNSQSRRLSR
jgi:hypothetical protein